MAEDLREVLAQYVPGAVLDDAVEAIKETDIAPEWWRTEMSKVAPDAKRARELEAELESIRSAPKRTEAYQRVGLKGDLPKYARDWLDQNIPIDKLDDLEFIAAKVKEGGYEVDLSQRQQEGDKPGAQQVTEAMSQMGPGSPPAPETYEAAMQAARTTEEVDAVYARFGKPVPQRS